MFVNMVWGGMVGVEKDGWMWCVGGFGWGVGSLVAIFTGSCLSACLLARACLNIVFFFKYPFLLSVFLCVFVFIVYHS